MPEHRQTERLGMSAVCGDVQVLQPMIITELSQTGMAVETACALLVESLHEFRLTLAGETVVVDGVTIVGPVNLAATAPTHASQLYARTISAFHRAAPPGCRQATFEYDPAAPHAIPVARRCPGTKMESRDSR